jgi:hypothetical protein
MTDKTLLPDQPNPAATVHLRRNLAMAAICATVLISGTVLSFSQETTAPDNEPAIAEDQAVDQNDMMPADQSSAKYQLEKQGDQFVRMELETGKMSICKIQGENLICRMAADDREALENEIASLQHQESGKNQASDDEAVKDDSGDEPAGEDQASGGEETARPLKPGEDRDRARRRDREHDEFLNSELDKALDYSARAMRKFFEVMKELREDLNR